MSPYLQDRKDLTIVSNDLATATAFLDYPGIDLICVGGRVDRGNKSMIGRLAALTLAELSLDIAFLSSSSWDVQHGVRRIERGPAVYCGFRLGVFIAVVSCRSWSGTARWCQPGSRGRRCSRL